MTTGLLGNLFENKDFLPKILSEVLEIGAPFVLQFHNIEKITAKDIFFKTGTYYTALKEVEKEDFEKILKEKLDIKSFTDLDYPYIPLTSLLIEATKPYDDLSQKLYSVYSEISNTTMQPEFTKEYEKITGLFLLIALLSGRTKLKETRKEYIKNWEIVFKAMDLDLSHYTGEIEKDLKNLNSFKNEIYSFLTKHYYLTSGIKVLGYNEKELFELIDALSDLIYKNPDFLKINFIHSLYKAVVTRLNTITPSTKNKPKKIKNKEAQLQNAFIGYPPKRKKGRPPKYKSYRKILFVYYTLKVLNKELKKINKALGESIYPVEDVNKIFSNFLDIQPYAVRIFINNIKKNVNKNNDFF
ncbi:hypothetical protein [Persephonella sp.]|nr:hypothetical protein [Persephonella sp.]